MVSIPSAKLHLCPYIWRLTLPVEAVSVWNKNCIFPIFSQRILFRLSKWAFIQVNTCLNICLGNIFGHGCYLIPKQWQRVLYSWFPSLLSRSVWHYLYVIWNSSHMTWVNIHSKLDRHRNHTFRRLTIGQQQSSIYVSECTATVLGQDTTASLCMYVRKHVHGCKKITTILKPSKRNSCNT